MYHNNGENGSVEGPFVVEKNIAVNIIGGISVQGYYGSYDETGAPFIFAVVFSGNAGSPGNSWIAEIYQVGGENECLFDYQPDDPPAPSPGLFYDYWVFDDFLDSYTATCTVTANGVTTVTTKTYNREGLCVWRAREHGEIDGQL